MKKLNSLFLVILIALAGQAQTVSTFEALPLTTDTFWNGSNLEGGFADGKALFLNNYSSTFLSWSGFAYSNTTDTVTAGYGNQYSSVTGSGNNGSAKYAVANGFGEIKIALTGAAAGKLVRGFYITNATFAYLSMRDGDAFAKKFGGVNGNDSDWFRLLATGWQNGAVKATTAEFYLADFRAADNSKDYIVKDWAWFDLQVLGNVDSISFLMESTDTAGGFGMNNPAYFVMDDFTTADIAYTSPVVIDDNVTITFNTDTIIDVTANDNTVLIGESSTAVEIISAPLVMGAGVIVTENKVEYIAESGIIAIDTLLYRLCDIGGSCDTGQLIITITDLTGINDLGTVQATIFPNPFTNVITIQSAVTINQVQILNVQGSVIKTVKVNANLSVVFDTQELNAGIYILRLNTSEGIAIKKIIKQ